MLAQSSFSDLLMGTGAMRGYFGIGVEGASKPMNFGNLARSAHGFGASFIFTVAPVSRIGRPPSDTSRSQDHLPWYNYDTVQDMRLPDGCDLVGVELIDDAIALPSFRHPLRAAYVLGPESGSLSPQMIAGCKYVVRIPTSFCINLAMAGVVVMYDRMCSTGRFAERLLAEGGPKSAREPHFHGKPVYSGATRVIRKRKEND